MNFNNQDKLEYISYLRNEIAITKEKPENIFNNHYLQNLQNEICILINLKINH